ncbi:hypothetical protein DPMN_169829 [Dreissena polymorpha]|uniref:Uncharacterized protein n=1 Tax=Dreissena polymorpha TaxID=45954 RepID=A0A9D4DXG8_DREPO|nr:hypothetical protein DPMN_169829 [Dreissena polymorpha]
MKRGAVRWGLVRCVDSQWSEMKRGEGMVRCVDSQWSDMRCGTVWWSMSRCVDSQWSEMRRGAVRWGMVRCDDSTHLSVMCCGAVQLDILRYSVGFSVSRRDMLRCPSME